MIGTVLIVDSVATNRIVMKVKLGAAGYRTLTAPDGAACLELARLERPDLILLDVDMPETSGIDILHRLRADPATSRMLVVMVSSSEDGDQRLAALRAGADEFLSKPIDDLALFARLRNLARMREDLDDLEESDERIAAFTLDEGDAPFFHPGQIAIVTSKVEKGILLRRLLAECGRDKYTCVSQDQVFNQRAAGGAEPDAYLLEASLDETDRGLMVMSALRSRLETRHAKICILNTADKPVLPAMAFDLGANDLVTDDLNPEEIALRLNGLVRRKREADRLRARVKDNLRLAMLDPLTGIPNRRFGLSQLGSIADRSLADERSFALMVLDLDKFKSVNDRFGHASGDTVLVEVTRRLTGCLRNTDLISRIGGEEFLICLPNTTLGESRLIAERLCHEIESIPVRLHTGDLLTVTISIGLALSTETKCLNSGQLVSEIFDRADRALLAAKRAGRNQVTISRSAA